MSEEPVQSENDLSSDQPAVNPVADHSANLHAPAVGAAEVCLQRVGISAGDRTLLDDVSATIAAGKITLIIGPSGVGKSMLLKCIAGLASTFDDALRVRGEVRIDGRPARPGNSGVVFQNFALFDELTPLDNVRLARASAFAADDDLSPAGLLEELQVPVNVPTSRLSGGQRQRLAIARTLMFNAPVMLYDEPTSGLDPLTGKSVAQLILDTHRRHQQTSIIVTHDYLSLMPIADHVFLLDPAKAALEEIPRSGWAEMENRLTPLAPIATRASHSAAEATNFRFVRHIGKSVAGFFSSTTNALLMLLTGLVGLLPLWRNPVWGLRYFWHFLKLVTGPSACLYMLASGLISGFVTTWFTFKFLPFANYTEPLLVEDLLVALGFATYRIFVPVLSCVLIAARCGSAVTADIGGRQYGNQLDAMRTFGMPPRQYLLTPVIWSFLIGTPLLSLLAFCAARFVGLVVFLSTHGGLNSNFWHYWFHRGLEQPDAFFYRGTGWLMAKLLVSGFGVALISWTRAVGSKNSSSDVSRSITSTILWGTLYVLTVHFLFSLFEFENVVPGSR